jgi:hypothetical protein
MAHWATENSSKTTSTTITPFFDTGNQPIQLIGNGPCDVHGIAATFTTKFIFHMSSVYLRRGSNNFAQVVGFQDTNVTYVDNFDLLNDTVGLIGSEFTTPLMQPETNGSVASLDTITLR